MGRGLVDNNTPIMNNYPDYSNANLIIDEFVKFCLSYLKQPANCIVIISIK